MRQGTLKRKAHYRKAYSSSPCGGNNLSSHGSSVLKKARLRSEHLTNRTPWLGYR